MTVPTLGAAPLVAVIVLNWNQAQLTLDCLASLEALTYLNFWTVVVDNGSTDDSVARIRAVYPHIEIVALDANLGYAEGNNRGIAHALARGAEYVLILNNDTLVTPGWLPALLSALAQPDVGLVGAKLIYPDGALQEAGGILWRNGSASNYGRNDDASKPEFNYVLDVDYCSGACLVIRREEFLELGGFDPHFSPAYYEDADLAMRIRAMGKRVVVPRVLPGPGALELREIRSPARDLAKGAFGVLEPRVESTRAVPPGEVDCAVVPGMAFDREGRRLGRGGGYFDRLLARLAPGVARVGLAFRCQVLDELPIADHDEPVHRVLFS